MEKEWCLCRACILDGLNKMVKEKQEPDEIFMD